MIQKMVRYTRLYFVQAWYSYRALFAWSTPFNYFAHKFGFPFFAMLLFVFMGQFVGFTNPIYIVLGNILRMPASNGIGGVSMTIGNEKQFGAMSYLLGSPAPRAPLFLGRALFHILDGFATVLLAFPIAIMIFKVDFTASGLFLALFCALLISVTTTGIGFVFGSISLISRDGWMYTSILSLSYYILAGINFPVTALPVFLQTVSYCLPMTRGILAARMALSGGGWSSISHLIYGEVLVGVVYTVLGFAMFRFLERRSMIAGTLDNL
jgi:ABC-2 type transport system permease protein